MTNLLRNRRLLIVFSILTLILTLILPRTSKFNYDYRQGSVWKYDDLEARFDFPIFKSAEQLAADERYVSSIETPSYSYVSDAEKNSLDKVWNADLGKYSGLRQGIVNDLRKIYSNGVVSDEGLKLSRKADIGQSIIYLSKGKTVEQVPASEIITVKQAKDALCESLAERSPGVNADSLLKKSGIYDAVEAVLQYDEARTALMNETAYKDVSPTEGYVEKYDIIVKKGEIITEDIARKLDSYKAEYERRRTGIERDDFDGFDKFANAVSPWIGNFLIALAISVILCLSVFFSNANILDEMGRLLFIILVFLLLTIVTLIVDKYNSAFLFMVPFTIAALWLQSFYRLRVVIPVYTVSLLPLLIFAHNGPILFVMFLMAGYVSVYVYDMFNRGLMQFMVSLICFAMLLISLAGFRMIGALSGGMAGQVILLAVGSLVSVIGYPLVFLFERMFKLVSSARLMELCDTESKLLRELDDKAPGTYNHSVAVAGMCEAAARAIGANPLVVKAGALYHDIGKMANPNCFVENESAEARQEGGYHSKLSPKESAQAIISHVRSGMELAGNNGLPQLLKDFILTHHGTTVTGYFYTKYVNDGGDPDDKEAFTYDGKRPFSKEQVILMICDSVEAASRTVTPSKEAYSELVEKLVAGKMKEGQLEDADISLKELNMVKESIKSYLMQSHHERVVYPTRKRFGRGR